MGRKAGIFLSKVEKKTLRQFMAETKDKREHRAASGILLRSDGKSTKEVAEHFGVTTKQVFAWTRFFRAKGVKGLHMKNPTGRTPIKAEKAKEIILPLLRQDPQVFGYLKGRWVLRDIARELKKQGVPLDFSSVHRILCDIGVALKSPTFRAPGSIHKNYRKRKQVDNYKQVAAMLLKKR